MPAESIELLIEFTKDEDARTRAMAVAGLAKLRDPRGFAPVLVTLFDPADEVRIAAATALGLFDDVRAFEPLVQALSDPCEQVRINATWSLGQMSATRCLDRLLDMVVDSDLAPALRTAAVTAIGERAELEGSDLATSDELIERTRSALLAVLDDPYDELRATAVWTLGHLPSDARTTEECIRMLDDSYEWVVRYAIEALAHFKDRAAVEKLETLARSDNDAIRTLAMDTLALFH